MPVVGLTPIAARCVELRDKDTGLTKIVGDAGLTVLRVAVNFFVHCTKTP
jgi:hypothetical protein